MRIDLQNDPEIATGRDLIEHLVGAHLVAHDEEELLHMVGVSISEINQADTDHSIRVLVHAVYRSQSLIVKLLDMATPGGASSHEERRLQLWSEVRDS